MNKTRRRLEDMLDREEDRRRERLFAREAASRDRFRRTSRAGASAGGTLEQRRATRSALRSVRESRLCARDFEVRDVIGPNGSKDLTFTGVASVTEAPYEIWDDLGSFEETMAAGAFTKTLREGADCTFLYGHNRGGVPMARTGSGTMTLSEDLGGDLPGLHVTARLDGSRPDVATLRSAIDRGDVNSMSIGFFCIRDTWDADYTRRRITEVSLNGGDVSVVDFGANPATDGSVSLRRGSRRMAAPVVDLNVQLKAIASRVARGRAAEARLRKAA